MMKKLNIITALILLFASALFGGEKKVLVEVLTNSHCPLCPPAHSAIDSYLQSANSDKIEYIYYHMSFPYPSDQLYQHNTPDATAKNNFYGPHSSTPKAYFDGTLVSNSYSNWGTSLDGLVAGESSFDISLSGNFTENDFTISAGVTLTGNISSSDLIINYVVVENVNYSGNNGISNHKNVMRKIVNPEGDPIELNLNEAKMFSTTIAKNGEWNTGKLKIIVFVQSKGSKEVFQSESISYSELNVTGIETENHISNSFKLNQNYPNPFNPTTTITYSVPKNGYVLLNVYDILGNEIQQLVNESKSAGSYSIKFDASNLANGVYYYQLRSGNFVQTRKMIFMK